MINGSRDACPACGGGFPGDVPDSEVCQCGSAWAKPKPKGLQRKTPLKQTAGLKPGKPLKRGQPLKQTASLTRTGPIPRAAPIAKKTTRARREGESNDIPAAVRAVVLARCRGLCEACGKSLGDGTVHMHHRKRRTKRNHVPCNIVALHPTCHVLAPEAVHQRPAWAAERGLIVRAGADPDTTPVTLPSGLRVLLDPALPQYLPASEALSA